jgi:1-acyl-sn-glycerol-3-phosphate acyltransferase
VDYLLRNGISVVVVVGGAHEALNARPATNDLTLARRLGFVRLALQHGASLVPVYSFGENAVYRQLVPNPPGSLVRRLQELLLRWFGYSLPLISGVGLLPLPRRITTVIGTPVPVPLRPHPTLAEVLEVHGRYVRALQALFDEYKDVAGDADEAALNVVDALSARDLQREERRLEKGLLLPPSDAQLLPISRL